MNAFVVVAILWILVGSLLSAYRARWPSRFMMWAVSYMVLIAGLAQLGLVVLFTRLTAGDSQLGFWMFVIYNIAAFLTVYGRYLRGTSLVLARAANGIATVGFLTAVALLFVTIGHRSDLVYLYFVAISAVIIVGALIGSILSFRRFSSK